MVRGKVGIPYRLNTTRWVAAITPTDRPKSVRNRCVFGGVFGFWSFCWCYAFCHMTDTDRCCLFSLSTKIYILFNNMDHMRISGTEPSSVILIPTRLFKNFKKLKRDAQKVKCKYKLKTKGMV